VKFHFTHFGIVPSPIAIDYDNYLTTIPCQDNLVETSILTMMNVVISTNDCISRASVCVISTEGDYTRRLTDSDLVIDFNALDASSMTLHESDCRPRETKELHEVKYYLSSGNPLKTRKEQGTNANLRTLKTNQDDATATTVATSVTETDIALDDSTLATVASTSTLLNPPRSIKRVRFGSLTIHEHVVELGGSGLPGVGPAISLGWRAESHLTVDSVEAYEDARPCLPRKGIEMLLPKRQRVDMLLECGYTFNQIRVSTQECEALRKQRARTVQHVSFENRTKSTLKKLLVWKKSE